MWVNFIQSSKGDAVSWKFNSYFTKGESNKCIYIKGDWRVHFLNSIIFDSTFKRVNHSFVRSKSDSPFSKGERRLDNFFLAKLFIIKSFDPKIMRFSSFYVYPKIPFLGTKSLHTKTNAKFNKSSLYCRIFCSNLDIKEGYQNSSFYFSKNGICLNMMFFWHVI